jgi:hypothetical protein
VAQKIKNNKAGLKPYPIDKAGLKPYPIDKLNPFVVAQKIKNNKSSTVSLVN